MKSEAMKYISGHVKKKKVLPNNEPLWKGPIGDPRDPMVGVTFSLLSKFLVCRERFRLSVIEGIQPRRRFETRIEFGQMWHACEEVYNGFDADGKYKLGKPDIWGPALKSYCQGLLQKYPDSIKDVEKWYQVCKRLFPVYVEYWKKHPDMIKKINLFSEQVFSVPYRLPSGREVVLRGKWDSGDFVTKGNKELDRGVWLQENKSKGDIDEWQLLRQLKFDLQTGIYLVALKAYRPEIPGPDYVTSPTAPLRGVRYNVIRRPLSGGKHSIRQKKAKVTKKKTIPAETNEAYYKRLEDCFKKDPGFFFMRWNVRVTDEDLSRFRNQCLDPILEQLCDWYEYVAGCKRHGVNVWDNDVSTHSSFNFVGTPWAVGNWHPSAIHWRHPFGVFNVLNEGGATVFDEYMATGSMVGMERITELFTELN